MIFRSTLIAVTLFSASQAFASGAALSNRSDDLAVAIRHDIAENAFDHEMFKQEIADGLQQRAILDIKTELDFCVVDDNSGDNCKAELDAAIIKVQTWVQQDSLFQPNKADPYGSSDDAGWLGEGGRLGYDKLFYDEFRKAQAAYQH